MGRENGQKRGDREKEGEGRERQEKTQNRKNRIRVKRETIMGEGKVRNTTEMNLKERESFILLHVHEELSVKISISIRDFRSTILQYSV